MQFWYAVPEAGLMNGTRLAIAFLMAVVLAGPVAAETFTIEYLPSLYVMDAGAGGHMMNNYTIKTDANDIGAWTVLGTDNQMEFAHLDGRNVSFAAGVSQQFYTPSLTNYRYYYILLQSGFSIGSTIEMHFNHTNPPQTPTYLTQKMVNFTVKRSPIVLLFDFNQTGAGPNLANYSILSSDTLANSQDWTLYGTDTAEIIGYNNPAIFTTVDTQTAQGFTAGVKKTYEFSSTQHFRYYVLYLSSGWYTVGTDVEIRFGTGAFLPTPTPTPPPGANCTADFHANITEGSPPLGVQFNITGNNSVIDSASWMFGEGNTSIEINPFHLYEVYGRWNVAVTYQNTTYGDICTISKSRYIHVVEPEQATYVSPTLFTSLLILVFGGFVYSIYDNKNRYYGNIIVGIIITIIAFYLALAAMNGSIMDPVNIIEYTNHTIQNGTVGSDVNISISTAFSSSYKTHPVIFQSSLLGWFLIMVGLFIGVITSINILEVILTIKEKSWR